MTYSRPLTVFFGHHKCATAWIDNILIEACFNLGWDYQIVHRPADFAPFPSLGKLVATQKPDLLAYTNADRDHITDLPPFRGFHVVRDPRDVIVSGYFSHLHSHPVDNWPELAAHRQQLQAVSKEKGLLLEMTFSYPFLDQMRRWNYTQPNVLEMTLEEMSAQPEATFRRIFQFLGMLAPAAQTALQRSWKSLIVQLNILNRRGRPYTPFNLPIWPVRFPQRQLPDHRVQAIVNRKSFAKMSGGRVQGQEDVRHHYRKGVPGDWRNHFTPEHIARFKQMFNDLLLQLGYETDEAWQ